MSKKLTIVVVAVLALGAGAVRPARAHFILLKPDSWLNEDQSALFGGAPQKAGPCGPGGGDDIQPVPTNDKVTTVHVGEVLHVSWQITVQHTGYFRVSLAKDRADFKDPHLDDPVACTYDMASVQTGAHDNVLMDGIDANATMQDITVPDMPCDKCTLQVIQVMKDHGPPNCIYYHCADVQILAANDNGGSGGSSGSGGAGAGSGGTGAAGSGAGGNMGAAGASSGSGGTGGGSVGSGSGGSSAMPTGAGSGGRSGTAGTPPVGSGGMLAVGGSGGAASVPTSSTKSSGGCALSEPGARASRTSVWFAVGFGVFALQRRRRRRA